MDKEVIQKFIELTEEQEERVLAYIQELINRREDKPNN